MPERLLKNFSIEVQEKLYEEKTAAGDIQVYATLPFGVMLTLNDEIILSESDSFFQHEMMSHPALFTHPQPKKIALIGPSFGVLPEILKHSTVMQVDCLDQNPALATVINHYFPQQKEVDSRVNHDTQTVATWLTESPAETYDVIVQMNQTENFLESNLKNYFRILKNDGILLQPWRSALLHANTLPPIYQNIQQAGFSDWQILNFPQPSFPPGLRTAIMTSKATTFHRIRESAIFNRPFSTRYYNFDVHKAALVVPEFIRLELAGQQTHGAEKIRQL